MNDEKGNRGHGAAAEEGTQAQYIRITVDILLSTTNDFLFTSHELNSEL